jgi:transaldolase
MADPLTDLSTKGVSIWLDGLSRQRLVTGSLAGLVAHDHVVGVTTNPAIFGRVLAGMNVNIWDVNEMIQAIVRGGRTVDASRLADPRVPLDEFA